MLLGAASRTNVFIILCPCWMMALVRQKLLETRSGRVEKQKWQSLRRRTTSYMCARKPLIQTSCSFLSKSSI